MRNSKHSKALHWCMLMIVATVIIAGHAYAGVLTATATGSPTPPTSNSQSVTNGDFLITQNTSVPIVGDGLDERTSWVFDFTTDPGFSTFLTTAPLRAARLILTLTPKRSDRSSDVVLIEGLPSIGTPLIRTLPIGITTTIQLELLDFYTASDILEAFTAANGRLAMRYGDDAIVSFAQLALENVSSEFWQQNPAQPDMIFWPGQVGIGFTPASGYLQPEHVDLQVEQDVQTNTWLRAGNGVSVNLTNGEAGGFTLERKGVVLGQLVLEANDEVSLIVNNNLHLRAGGSIVVDDLTIKVRGSDFVFDKDYQLRTLTEVEHYIATYRHLPDLPAAVDMENKGAAVGEMQMKLLQKIEELTLYVIAQNKQLQAQTAELVRLKSEHAAQRSQQPHVWQYVAP